MGMFFLSSVNETIYLAREPVLFFKKNLCQLFYRYNISSPETSHPEMAPLVLMLSQDVVGEEPGKVFTALRCYFIYSQQLAEHTVHCSENQIKKSKTTKTKGKIQDEEEDEMEDEKQEDKKMQVYPIYPWDHVQSSA